MGIWPGTVVIDQAPIEGSPRSSVELKVGVCSRCAMDGCADAAGWSRCKCRGCIRCTGIRCSRMEEMQCRHRGSTRCSRMEQIQMQRLHQMYMQQMQIE
eukprot:scaffold303777_cov18-Tisochrysis_lutea.AAC.1